jgi:hypothetical protein
MLNEIDKAKKAYKTYTPDCDDTATAKYCTSQKIFIKISFFLPKTKIICIAFEENHFKKSPLIAQNI